MSEKNQITRRSLFAGAIVSATSSFSWLHTPAQAAVSDIQHGSRSIAKVALTFHGAGDDAINRSLLQICIEQKLPITVFAVGSWLESSPTIAKSFYESGCEIGNHTLNHKPMKTLSYSQALKEILGGAEAIKKLFGTTGVGFRPSGTQFSTATIRKAALKAGYKNIISYDVDSHDYQDPPVKTIIKNFTAGVKPGSIVSLHLGHKNTVEALPGIIKVLEEKKLKPVHISELIKA